MINDALALLADVFDAPAFGAPVLEELRGRVETWMRETGDPLLDGPVPAPPGAELNDRDQVSPAEPAGSVH